MAFCAGIAGLMIASNTSAADANNAGLFIELDAILAVVIGGTSLAGGRFSLTGTLIGAMFIQTLATTIPTMGIPAETNYLFKAVVVIVVCLLQSPKARAALRRTTTDAPAREGNGRMTAVIAPPERPAGSPAPRPSRGFTLAGPLPARHRDRRAVRRDVRRRQHPLRRLLVAADDPERAGRQHATSSSWRSA